MSDLKPKYTTIKLEGKEYPMLFNLNAIDEIQDRFDIPISQLGDMLSDERKVFKVLKCLISILINEAIEDAETGEQHVSENFVGRKITIQDIAQLKDSVFSSFTDALPTVDEESPNAKSE